MKNIIIRQEIMLLCQQMQYKFGRRNLVLLSVLKVMIGLILNGQPVSMNLSPGLVPPSQHRQMNENFTYFSGLLLELLQPKTAQ